MADRGYSPTSNERDCAVRHAIGGLILSRRGFWVTAIGRDLGQPLPAGRRRCFKMRTLIDPRHTNRVPVATVNRRHARARRQVLRELDRLGEKRRVSENESR